MHYSAVFSVSCSKTFFKSAQTVCVMVFTITVLKEHMTSVNTSTFKRMYDRLYWRASESKHDNKVSSNGFFHKCIYLTLVVLAVEYYVKREKLNVNHF